VLRARVRVGSQQRCAKEALLRNPCESQQVSGCMGSSVVIQPGDWFVGKRALLTPQGMVYSGLGFANQNVTFTSKCF